MRNIQYGIDRDTGLVWSRIGSQVAVPVLQYDKMTPQNNFQTIYELEKMDVIHSEGFERLCELFQAKPGIRSYTSQLAFHLFHSFVSCHNRLPFVLDVQFP